MSESVLSPKSQLELFRVLKGMSEAGHAQFIIAMCFPIFMACYSARIYSFDTAPIKHVDCEEIEH
ncbi:MAG: hypothetical protein JRD93_12525 [Deltaproteobacteria bacterium]|nr:hypothetical protein [Deltaproteobacteria bacterium]MBW2662783.1 hypothetical protein [Deltaproteobacteria bacterium]